MQILQYMHPRLKLLLVILLASVTGALAQKSCLDQSIVALQKLQELDKAHSLLLEYAVTTEYRQGEQQQTATAQENILLQKNGGKSFVKGNDLKMYQDDKYQIAILQQQQMVLVSRTSPANTSLGQLHSIFNMRDSLMRASKVVGCTNLKMGNIDVRKAEIELHQQLVSLSGINRIEVWSDLQSNSLKKLVLYFHAEQEIRRVVIELKQLSANALSQEPFSGTALSKVLDKDGKLLAAYKNFTLKDLR
jgi:hypothetical protein